MQTVRKKNLFLDAVLFLILGIGLLQLAFRFPEGEIVYRISADTEGYYLYLPGLFIYEGFEQMPVRTTRDFGPHPYSGKTFTRFTYGVALMQSPVFLLTHLTAKKGWFHAKAPDGYSNTYNDGLILANVIYVVLGLWTLFLCLRRYFSRSWSWGIVGMILLGTNYFYYAVGGVGMSHIYTFFLVACLMYVTPVLIRSPGLKQFLLLGGILALITLIRPVNLLFALYPLLYQVYSREDMKNRIRWMGQNWRFFLLFPLCMFFVWLPQFYYWKVVCGEWIYNGYPVGFDHWKNPFFPEIWISVQNGWLIYSPIMVFALGGLIYALRTKKFSAPALILIFVVLNYLCASWSFWWFGGAFGYRPFIDIYPLLALPMGLWIKRLFQYSWWVKISLSLIFIMACYYNLGLAYAYRYPWEGPSWNWATFAGVLEQLF